MVRDKIIQDLQKVATKLKLDADKISVDYPPNPKFGDYTTNLALQQPKRVSGRVWQSTMEIAKKITEAFGKPNYLEKIEIVPPGFINFFLSKKLLQSQVSEILRKKEEFAKVDLVKGKKVNIEFVSANPTGQLHIGNARGGPIGDTLANILKMTGFKVIREYYINDVGNQVETFRKTWKKILEEENKDTLIKTLTTIGTPEQGPIPPNWYVDYQGAILRLMAWIIRDSVTGEHLLNLSSVEQENLFKKKAKELLENKDPVGIVLKYIKKDLHDSGIEFDKWTYESLVMKKFTKKTIAKLKTVKKEGALWFAPKDEFLKDRESVLVRSDGSFTYFANDIAYHENKFDRGYNFLIDIWGSGHHGHIPRIQAAMQALGFDVSKLKFILYQFVRVKRGNEIIRMSKRAGNFVTAREVLDEVGKDAFRFFMLMYDPATHMDFDLELAKKKSADNPVYYVQYAHARICSIFRKAKAESGTRSPDYSRLIHPAEIALIKQLIRLPEIIYDISQNFAVHRLANFSVETANVFHKFYEQCKVISKDYDLSKARLSLVFATKIIIAATLKLMGISAPERM